jgi:glycerophosphoryl diester phosphodiesterase
MANSGELKLKNPMSALLNVNITRPALHPFLATCKPLAVAHRGGGGLWPQNTLYAFERALALGVDVLETDVQTTADGVLVAIHDEVVDSTTDGSGPVRSLTLKQIKALDAGYRWTADGGSTFPFRDRGIRIPTFEELLQAFPGARLNIDIKPSDPAVVDHFINLLEEHQAVERVLVASSYFRQLAHFRRICPRAATAASVREIYWFFRLDRIGLPGLFRSPAVAFQVPEINRAWRVVSPHFVRSAHRAHKEVHVWTVDVIQDMRRLLDWGVDGLMSNYPDRLMALLER